MGEQLGTLAQWLTGRALEKASGVGTETIRRTEHTRRAQRPCRLSRTGVTRRLSVALDIEPAQAMEFYRAMGPEGEDE